MIRSAETTKILVGLLFILVVGPSTFLGTGISMPVAANDSESNGAALPVTHIAAANRDDRLDSMDSEESDDSIASLVPENSDNTATDAIKQTYRSLRSNAIQSELGITEAVSDNDNRSSSLSNDSTAESDVDTPTIQQSSSVGSFTVTRDLDILFSNGQTGSEHLQYSGQVQAIPGGGWTTSVQGSCVNQGPSQTVSVSPSHATVGYDSNTGTIIVLVFPDTQLAVCVDGHQS